VRKVERQFSDIAINSKEKLKLNSQTPEEYIKSFSWDFSAYPNSNRQLSEIVSQIQSIANKVDEELKKMISSYNDKSLILTTLQRKKIINLTTSDFEDFLTPESVARLEILRAEGDSCMETIMAVCPKSIENGNNIFIDYKLIIYFFLEYS
jgi:hypothetical protein